MRKLLLTVDRKWRPGPALCPRTYMSIKQASVWFFRLTVLYNIFNLFSIKLFFVYNCFYVKKIKNRFYKLKKYFNIFFKKHLKK
jgi:hypothetical protein